MSVRSIEALQRYLRRLCDEAVPSEDAVLLNRFVTAHDREALELLIARHGPMVLGTARRLVDNTHDAEDVFQAVFLSLVRLAKTIRQGALFRPGFTGQPVGSPRRSAGIGFPFQGNRCRSPAKSAIRKLRLVWQEVRQALDEELQRLPERIALAPFAVLLVRFDPR